MYAYLLVELSKFTILVGNSHALQITLISDSLKVSADEEKVYFVFVFSFEGSNLVVDGIESTMAAAFNGDLTTKQVINIEPENRFR